MKPVIELMMKKDMAEVYSLDASNNGYNAWHEKMFRKHSVNKDVAEVAYHPDTGEVLGFYLYRIGKKKIFLYKFEVSAKGRELDCHKYMVKRLLGKCKPYERETVEIMTPDTSDYLKTHLFSKNVDFLPKMCEISTVLTSTTTLTMVIVGQLRGVLTNCCKIEHFFTNKRRYKSLA